MQTTVAELEIAYEESGLRLSPGGGRAREEIRASRATSKYGEAILGLSPDLSLDREQATS